MAPSTFWFRHIRYSKTFPSISGGSCEPASVLLLIATSLAPTSFLFPRSYWPVVLVQRGLGQPVHSLLESGVRNAQPEGKAVDEITIRIVNLAGFQVAYKADGDLPAFGYLSVGQLFLLPYMEGKRTESGQPAQVPLRVYWMLPYTFGQLCSRKTLRLPSCFDRLSKSLIELVPGQHRKVLLASSIAVQRGRGIGKRFLEWNGLWWVRGCG